LFSNGILYIYRAALSRIGSRFPSIFWELYGVRLRPTLPCQNKLSLSYLSLGIMGVAGGGINKAELARTPKEVLWWRIWLTAIWASFCGGLHGFNTSNISGIMGMSAFLRDFGFRSLSKSQLANTEGWVVSAMLLVCSNSITSDIKSGSLTYFAFQGQLTGVILSGPANERFGRKFSIFCAATLYTVGAILMAANFGSLSELLVGRVFSGLGSGFGMTTGAIYISEISPKAIRGCLSTFYNVNIMAGVTASVYTF
jgi:SP family sugar:H+ symporter-like MFS transporter